MSKCDMIVYILSCCLSCDSFGLQVDALVSPMLGDAPRSSKVGKCLLSKGGRQFSTSLEQTAQSWNTVPGGVHVVDGEGGLVGCSVIFLHCVRWDGDPQGAAVQVCVVGSICVSSKKF